VTLCSVIAWRLFVLRDVDGDWKTWKPWAYLLLACYMLPSVNIAWRSKILEKIMNSSHTFVGAYEIGLLLISNV
jgi:hypothetical protein